MSHYLIDERLRWISELESEIFRSDLMHVTRQVVMAPETLEVQLPLKRCGIAIELLKHHPKPSECWEKMAFAEPIGGKNRSYDGVNDGRIGECKLSFEKNSRRFSTSAARPVHALKQFGTLRPSLIFGELVTKKETSPAIDDLIIGMLDETRKGSCFSIIKIRREDDFDRHIQLVSNKITSRGVKIRVPEVL